MSSLLDGKYSHDQVTHLLPRKPFDSKMLCLQVKKMVREIKNDDRMLIADDTIQEKLYSDENNLTLGIMPLLSVAQ